MATLNVIRRWALREQMSIREISRRTGLACNTVKKYLRSDEVEPKHAGQTRPSKLDPYAEKLALWLEMEVTKSRKQRRNLKQIHTINCWLVPNGRKSPQPRFTGYELARNGLQLGYKQKRLTEVGYERTDFDAYMQRC